VYRVLDLSLRLSGALVLVMKPARKPNFLFIGAAKTGSSWLYEIMLQHPDVFVPRIKDPYFFDRFYDKGLDWYLRLFAKAPAGSKAVGELSHDYLYSAEAAHRIRHDLADVRLIACLRNPMEHIVSSYVQMVHAGITRAPLDEAVRTLPVLVDEPSYSRYLPVWLELFDRSRIKLLLFDDLRVSPRGFAQQVFDFLGVETPDFIDYDRVVNAADVPRSYLLSRIVAVGAAAARRSGLVNLVGTLKRNPLILQTLYRPVGGTERPRLSERERLRLAAHFCEEIDRVQDLVGRDLSAWQADW
jgi:hypothetical protein